MYCLSLQGSVLRVVMFVSIGKWELCAQSDQAYQLLSHVSKSEVCEIGAYVHLTSNNVGKENRNNERKIFKKRLKNVFDDVRALFINLK
jgi:hypothetical protein